MEQPQTHPSLLSPFDSPDKADLVIQTSDKQHLFVRKAFLIHSSVFFHNLFADSSPEEMHQKLPMYEVPEDSRTMCGVLRLCYPVADASWDIIGEILAAAILPALKKCMMDDAEERLRIIVAHSDVLHKKEPLKAFAIACHLGLNDVARTAARNLLSVPLQEQRLTKELRIITGFDFQLLLDYYLKCSNAAVRALESVAKGGSIAVSCPLDTDAEARWKGLRPAYDDSSVRFQVNEGDERVVYSCFYDILTDAIPRVRACPGVGLLDAALLDQAIASASSAPHINVGNVRWIFALIDEQIKFDISTVVLQFDK